MMNNKKSIGLEITLIIAALVLIFLAASITLSHFCLFDSYRNGVMEARVKIARLMAGSVAMIMEQQAGPAKANASFGDPVFDESKGVWAVPLSVTAESKTLIDISVFFKPLEGFRVGRSGKAALIDSRGYLIYYPGLKPFSNKFCEYNQLEKVLREKKGWSVIDTVYMETGKVAVAFSPINGTKFYVAVFENRDGLFAPLNRLTSKMTVFSVFLAIIVILLAGILFKGVLTDPIKELAEGMRRLGNGNLEYRVNIKKDDEIGVLIEDFNAMGESLNRITAPVKTVEQEKAERNIARQGLEKESQGLFSIMSQVRGSLFQVEEALKSQQNNKELAVLQSRLDVLGKNLDREIYASGLETGRIDFKMAPDDLRSIVKESVFIFEPKVRAKGLDLRLDISKSALFARLDKEKIRQVLDILIENSLRSTEKGYIAISIAQAKDRIECSVTDTGAAIPKESIDKIFDRFGNFDRVKQKEECWPSPDLYIAKAIVEKHGGRIQVDSRAGDMTRFVFNLVPSSAK